MGENLDGDLGSYTTSKIIGDIDGRLKGSASFGNPMPVSEFNNIYYSPDGLPVSTIYYLADRANKTVINGLTNIFYNEQSDLVAPSCAPTLRGTAGGAPLPNDWEGTVWQDIGLIPVKRGHFSSQIKNPYQIIIFAKAGAIVGLNKRFSKPLIKKSHDATKPFFHSRITLKT